MIMKSATIIIPTTPARMLLFNESSPRVAQSRGFSTTLKGNGREP
jgi:hypothetical protein